MRGIKVTSGAGLTHCARQANVIACCAYSNSIIIIASKTTTSWSGISEISCRTLGTVISCTETGHASNAAGQANSLVDHVIVAIHAGTGRSSQSPHRGIKTGCAVCGRTRTAQA
jgi:hypothetical protein